MKVSVAVLFQLFLVSFALPVVSLAADSPDQAITYPEDIRWKTVVAPDAQGRAISVFMLYGQLEQKEPTEFLMKYSAGRRATPHLHSGDYYAVVVSGKFRHFRASGSESRPLTRGATWFQKANVVHDDRCEGPEDCVLNVFFPTGFDVKFVDHK
jgi:quercetin dioxygenase-like cupin family protein